ncbi:MAG: hypothetical protein ACI4XM_02445 [Candidatus Coprovivens sp.]
MKKIIITLVILLINIPFIKAETIEEKILENKTYINNEGVAISQENYDKIKDLLKDDEIENIDANIYDKIKNSEKAVAYETTIIKTEYIKIGNDTFVIDQEIIGNDNLNDISVTSATEGSVVHTTNYKQLHLWVFSNSDGTYTFVIQNSWKKIPSNKSFDVLAFRWEGNVTENKNTIYGEQNYKTSTSQVNPPYIEYQYGNGNYKYESNGVGLSQNLVNGDYYYVNQLEITASCSGTIKIYGTYQHAQGNLTLLDSKSYSISSGGLGNVLYYSNSTIRNTYDNMQGLSVSFIA